MNRVWLVAVVLLLSICTLGVITDASGFTQFGGTVIRIVRGEGVVVLEVDDPDVQVSLDGDQVVIMGAGPQEIRLPTGQHEFKANKADETVYHQVVTVSRGGRQIVRVRAGSHSRRQTVRHVWPDRVTKRGAPSPDGREVTATDWETGDLAVFDIATKTLRRITGKGMWSDSAGFAEHHIWSPDGQQIAYSWYSDEAEAYELRIASARDKDVAEPRVISKHDYLIPYAWSPDGEYILAAVEQPKEPFGLKKIFTSDGTIRLLKALDGGYPVKASISPDGKYVVYDTENDDIHILEIESDPSTDTVLLAGSSDDYGPLWSPDGKHIVFISDRSGSVSLWVQKMDGASPSGNARPVGIDMNYMAPLGISNEGTYFYGDVLFSDSTDIHVLTLGNNGSPERLKLRFPGVNGSPTWSPDGIQLAYSRRIPRVHAFSLIVHSFATGDEKVLLDSAGSFYTGQQPLWSPDGGAILLVGRWVDNERGVYSVDVESSEVTSLTTSVSDDERLLSGAWSPDGKAIYFIRARAYSASNPGRSSLIVKMDIATRTETTIHEQPSKPWDKTTQVFPGALAVSRDGEWLAVTDQQTITLVPSAGGPPKILAELPADQAISLAAGLVWTADGQSLIFATGSSEEPIRWPTPKDKNQLWQVDVGSGQRHKLNIDIRGLGHMVLHPDGRRIAMTATTDDLPVRSGILALDNFLPLSDD